MSDEFLGEIIRKSLKRKLNTAANVAALAAAPFTGGSSLLANAARTGGTAVARGAQKKLMARRLAGAEKNLESAKQSAFVPDPETKPKKVAVAKPLDEAQSTLDVGIESPQPSSPMAGNVAKPDDPRPGGGQNITGEGTGQLSLEKLPGSQSYAEALEAKQGAKQKLEEIQQNIEQADLDNAITQQGTAAGISSAGAVVGADIQQRAERDRQRTEQDYEKAREAASTGGAKSTTSG